MTRQTNDAEDFATFVRATGTQLYRTAFLLTGDHHLAEDLTQSTYAKLYARWRRVRGVENPVAYARTTLMNAFLSHRRLRRNTEVPTDEPWAGGPDSLRDADRPLDDLLAVRHDVLAALGLLHPSDRAVLVARYWEDRSVTETAADLGISEAAVRARAHRALARLRPHVRELDPGRTTT